MPVAVVKTNVQRVYGLSKKQKRVLKERLTFDNPKYVSAVRWSPWGPPANIDPYLTYFEDKGNYVEVPLHFPIPFKHVVIADKRVERPVKWPKLKVKLRPGQRKAFEAYLRNPENGQIVLDTGEGKTILAYAIASALGQKALVLVDRMAYAKPWFDDYVVAFGKDVKKSDVGLIKANTFRIGELVTVAFFQTLHNRDLTELSKEFGIIIHDESDTAAAPTRFNVVQSFKSKYRLAVSGTIKRSDGLEFLHRFLYGDFAVNLLGQGKNILRGDDVIINRVETGFNCKVPLRYAGVVERDPGDNDKELVVDYVKLLNLEANDERSNLIKLYFMSKELDEGHSCLAVTHRKKHAIRMGIALNALGYKTRILFGDTPDDLKDEIIDQANAGKIQCVVSTFNYIKRGANVTRWSRGFALTQTANETELRQVIGRIRRSRKGKDKIIWYDFTANSIAPYRRLANKRLALWRDMGFSIRFVRVPDHLNS